MGAGFSNSKTPPHLRGKWRTPVKLYASQDKEFQFTGDVAAEPHTALHSRYITKEENALVRFWDDFGGIVWCNPPYDDIMPWVHVAAHCCDRGTGCVMLVPASTSVDWWAEALTTVSEIRFVIGVESSSSTPRRVNRATGTWVGVHFSSGVPAISPKRRASHGMTVTRCTQLARSSSLITPTVYRWVRKCNECCCV